MSSGNFQSAVNLELLTFSQIAKIIMVKPGEGLIQKNVQMESLGNTRFIFSFTDFNFSKS